MSDVLLRCLADDEGQDLIEYTLLTATLAIAGLAAVTAIGAAINGVYTGWDAATQGLWEPEAPTS
jgi:Flp pilus assembly pilin Flp